ncbi:hypothetical protein FBALC1_04377 [Flavobacteriales bacterium ALC-1]|nr:hypothetical protein FBALC1_04377 [Flavobacteriales bacterium ALC-1]
MATLKIPARTNQIIINKLILIGNGFDLALDLKTKYEDFLFWYFKKFIINGLSNISPVINPEGEYIFSYNEDEMFLFYNKSNSYYEQVSIIQSNFFNSFEDIKIFLNQNIYEFTFTFKSSLLKKIYLESNSGWVDIEKAYFDLLKKELDKKNSEIDNLNKELKTIKQFLKDYLVELDFTKIENPLIAGKYISQFIKKVNLNDIIDLPEKNNEIITDQIYFLNFNYTPSLNAILNSSTASQLEIYREKLRTNQIHGDLITDSDFLIFGYGDEMDKDYNKIEEKNDNRFFDNIKSFKYAENSNYRDLLRFLNSENYQVIVYGHSCGLSDRLMLNEIFEHDNCKSIKIYYYNKQEFVNKTMDISRHFSSNKLMRKKIVEFDDTNLIPQVKDFYNK